MQIIRAHIAALLTLTLLLGASLSACTGSDAEQPAAADSAATPLPPTEFTVAGSSSANDVFTILTDAYTEQHPEVTFNYLRGGGSDAGIQGTLDGQVDMGAVARLPTDEEMSAGLVAKEIARDKMAVVISPDVPITELSLQQVQDIFGGTITNWSEVGGDDSAITVLVRESDHNGTIFFSQSVLEGRAFGDDAVVLESGSDYREALATVSSGIGYLKYGNLQQSTIEANAVIIDTLDPASKDGSYPHVTPVVLVYRADNTAMMQPLLDFIATPEAAALLEAEGFDVPTE